MEYNRYELSVTQIKVGQHQIGIIGLKETFEKLGPAMNAETDDVIALELLERLSKLNYIPDSSRGNYQKAFLKEYKKHIGQPISEQELQETSEGLVIKVLGEGCAQCNKLEQDVMKVLAELKLPADLEHIRNSADFSKFNAMGVPALIINGEVKSSGWVPSLLKIKEWLKVFITPSA